MSQIGLYQIGYLHSTRGPLESDIHHVAVRAVLPYRRAQYPSARVEEPANKSKF